MFFVEHISLFQDSIEATFVDCSFRHGFDLIPIYIPGARDGTYLAMKQESCDKAIDGNPSIVNRLRVR